MLRRFTREQFQNAATIDGNRLANALADLRERFNALRHDDVEARWFETKYVTHYRGCEASLGFQNYPPWVITDASKFQSITETLPTPAQRWRHKGIDVEGLNLDSSTLAGYQYAWTTSLWFERPVIIQRATAFLQTDDEFPNTFTFPNGGEDVPPPGNEKGDPCKDIQVLVHVANPFLTENASQDALELCRRDFLASAQNVSPIPATAIVGSMLPSANDYPQGIMIDFEFHEVVIPSKSRVYFTVVLPEYAGVYATPWADETVWRQFYSLCLTVLESTER
jgi:hypothetical protein